MWREKFGGVEEQFTSDKKIFGHIDYEGSL